MDDVEIAAAQLEEEAEGFMAFTGLRRPSRNDRFLLVVGMTGSGKSTFVSSCTRRQVTIGHGLQSCTGAISIFNYRDDMGRRVYLIDTPGFDDTDRSDAETLELLGTYLSASYAAGVHIDGVLFLHRITDVRVGGSGVRNLAMLRAMSGLQSYARFTFVTTMWPDEHRPGGPSDPDLRTREASLRSDDRFFGPFVSAGAAMMRHAQTGGVDAAADELGCHSARHIVASLLAQAERQPRMVLRIQRELADEGKTLAETAAGQIVSVGLLERQRQHERQMRELREEQARAARAARGREDATVWELQLVRQLSLDEAHAQMLQASMAEMHIHRWEVVYAHLEEMDRQFREGLQVRNQELADMEVSLRWLHEDSASQRSSSSLSSSEEDEEKEVEWMAALMEELEGETPSPTDSEYADQLDREMQHLQEEQEENRRMIEELRSELDQYQQSYSKFTGTKGNIVNGVANGLAAGVTSGLIAAGAAALCLVM